LQRHRTLERGHRVLVALLAHERVSQRNERERIVRIEPRGKRQLGERLVLTALLQVDAGEIAMRRGVVEVCSHAAVRGGRSQRDVLLERGGRGHGLMDPRAPRDDRQPLGFGVVRERVTNLLEPPEQRRQPPAQLPRPRYRGNGLLERARGVGQRS
jgi:hypothetical protein